MTPQMSSKMLTEQSPVSSCKVAPLWWSDWGNRALVGLGVYLLVYILLISLGWGSDRLYAYVAELGFAPILILGVVFAIRAIRHLPGDRQSQKAWALVGAGLAGLFIADAFWAWYTLGGSAEPFPSPADAFYFLSVVLMLLGVTRFPRNKATGTKYVRYWLDATILLISGLVAIGFFIIGPELLTTQSISIETAMQFVYPATILLLLIVVLLKILHRPRPGRIGVLTLFTAGVFIYFVSTLWWAYIESHGSYEFHVPTYALWMIGFALMSASPQRQVDVVRRKLPNTEPGELASRIENLLPYLAAGIALVVFTFAAAPLGDQFGILVWFVMFGALLLVVRMFLTLRENTQYQVDQLRQASEARIQALVEYSSDLISVLDRDLRFRFQSPSSRQLIGLSPDTFIDTPILDWAHDDDRTLIFDAIQDMIMNGHHEARFEWRLVGLHMRVAELETIASNELETPGVHGIVLNSRDISQRKRHERELDFRANYDALTGLLNREAFVVMLNYSLTTTHRTSNIGVMFIDLDRFKSVNDTLGHDAGDDLLIQVAERMRLSVRGQDIISRFAGDEFTVMLPDIDSTDELMAIAGRVRQSIDQLFTVAGTEVSISPSIGVTTTSISDRTAENLIRDADVAMYIAKRSGRDQSVLFQPEVFDEQIPADGD